ncbi:hypothetical protein [Mycolicibacterium sp. CR10]|uniref:hypothetical protein n=1 Tax=Mycolicibacterium sp. CR10 TaxID=2562314 RepID=UPI0010C0F87A|nr:hypothetical protein [Mycolicibacterium sp. CR10]
MKIENRTATQRLGRTARAIATAGIGLGIVLASAAMASAEPQTEAEIKAGCKEAGGTYTTTSSPKGRASECVWKSADGTSIDVYIDGEWINTLHESKPVIPTPPQVSNPDLAPSSPPPPPPVQNPLLVPKG